MTPPIRPTSSPPPLDGTAEIARTLGLAGAVPRRSKFKRVVVWGCVLLGICFVGFAFNRMRHPVPIRFETAEAKRGDLTVAVTATGTLQPVNTVEVGAEISGRVEKVLVDFNSPIKAGDVLAEIDPRQLRAQVQRSEASLEAAEAALKQANATLLEARQNIERAEQLARSSLVSNQELDAARATFERAEASVASASAQVTVSRASLNSERTNLEKAVVRSPIDGVVLARKVEPGQTVAASFQTPVLFKLAEDLGRMKLLVNVDEADMGTVREGQSATFTVDAFSDREFPARIVSLRNEPQTVQGVVSYEAVLSVDNADGLLRPGMTATATITVETRKDALLVPNAALRFTPPGAAAHSSLGSPRTDGDSAASFVWVLRNGKPERVELKKGLSDGRFVEVLGGAIDPGLAVLVDISEKQR